MHSRLDLPYYSLDSNSKGGVFAILVREILRLKPLSSFFFFFFFFFRATPVAFGSSHARGPIGAAAASYTTATAKQDLSHICELHHNSQIFNTMSKAMDWTWVLMDTSRFCYCHTTAGTPKATIFWPRAWSHCIFIAPPCAIYRTCCFLRECIKFRVKSTLAFLHWLHN